MGWDEKASLLNAVACCGLQTNDEFKAHRDCMGAESTRQAFSWRPILCVNRATLWKAPHLRSVQIRTQSLERRGFT